MKTESIRQERNNEKKKMKEIQIGDDQEDKKNITC